MKHTIPFAAAAVLSGLGVGAQAQDITGRVITSTPVVQQVQVPRQVCHDQPVAWGEQPRSGVGALIGAIAGAALGNTIGHGGGRALATGIGLVGGAAVGDRLDGGGPVYAQGMQQCSTYAALENRTVGYNVTYEYGGRQHTVQMPNDPGATIRLEVAPAGYAAPTDQGFPVAGVSAPAGTVVYRGIVASPAMVGSAVYPAYAPAYAPVYAHAYSPSYHPPVGISLGFSFGGGWGTGWGSGHRHHRHHHRHHGSYWR